MEPSNSEARPRSVGETVNGHERGNDHLGREAERREAFIYTDGKTLKRQPVAMDLPLKLLLQCKLTLSTNNKCIH